MGSPTCRILPATTLSLRAGSRAPHDTWKLEINLSVRSRFQPMFELITKKRKEGKPRVGRPYLCFIQYSKFCHTVLVLRYFGSSWVEPLSNRLMRWFTLAGTVVPLNPVAQLSRYFRSKPAKYLASRCIRLSNACCRSFCGLRSLFRSNSPKPVSTSQNFIFSNLRFYIVVFYI